MTATVIGVDPGIRGAIALRYPGLQGVQLLGRDLPLMAERGPRKRPVLDVLAFGEIVRECVTLHDPRLAVLEAATNMPGEGGTSSFRFGRMIGALHAVLVGFGLVVIEVPPSAWKLRLGLSRDKAEACKRAGELYPGAEFTVRGKRGGTKLLDGRAEAALLAFYGGMILGQEK